MKTTLIQSVMESFTILMLGYVILSFLYVQPNALVREEILNTAMCREMRPYHKIQNLRLNKSRMTTSQVRAHAMHHQNQWLKWHLHQEDHPHNPRKTHRQIKIAPNHRPLTETALISLNRLQKQKLSLKKSNPRLQSCQLIIRYAINRFP